jgi:hypothetical protein
VETKQIVLDPWWVWDCQRIDPLTGKAGMAVTTANGCSKRYPTYGKANQAAERLNQAYGAVRYAARIAQ